MSLIYGYDIGKPPRPTTPVKYTLEYPATVLNTASYPITATTRGYRYMSMNGFDSNTTITLMTHAFGTNVGKDMTECVMKYSMEFILTDGSLEYYNIETIDLKKLKLPKVGGRYNIFPLNKRFNVVEKTGWLDFSKYSMFSVYLTQESGTLSGDYSTLDVIVEVCK